MQRPEWRSRTCTLRAARNTRHDGSREPLPLSLSPTPPSADANAAEHYEVIEALLLAGAEETGATPPVLDGAPPPRAISRRKKKKGKKGKKAKGSGGGAGGKSEGTCEIQPEAALLMAM